MKLREIKSNVAILELGREECRVIRQALNEVCNGLDVVEFSTRMGAERQDVLDLLHRFQQLGDKLRSATETSA
jgi:hypothetical protein